MHYGLKRGGGHRFGFSVPMRMAVSHGAGLPARKYGLICDLRGSLRGVRNEDGKLVQVIEYDSFGNVIKRQGLDEGENMFVPLGFAGGLPDPDHDFIHFVFRDYDPDVGRWTAIDPLGYQGGDLDLYGYCGDDPVNWVDPLGLLAGGLIYAGEDIGEESALHWATRSIQPDNTLLEEAYYTGMGWLSSLWTPKTSDKTLSTLAGGYVARVLGPFGVDHVPNRIQRIRQHLRFDPPHHNKDNFHFDGTIGKPLQNLLNKTFSKKK